MVRLDSKPKKISIVKINTPTSTTEKEELERVYEAIKEIIKYVK